MQKDIIKSIFFNDLVLFIRVIHVFIIWSKGVEYKVDITFLQGETLRNAIRDQPKSCI